MWQQFRRCGLSLLLFTAILALLSVDSSGQTPTDGPGLPHRIYEESELFTTISTINANNGAPRSHGTLSMHNGYLVVVYAEGSGKAQGGFSFYDISDPYAPQLIHQQDDADTHELREAHNYGYSSSADADYVALQAREGIQFWDWTDVTAPTLLSYLRLPGVRGGDYSNANWWTFWQAPYVYVAGTNNGIYIVDASDPREPVLVDRGDQPNPVPISQTGGFRIGTIFAVGNLLAITGADTVGYATLDISDPVNPSLLTADMRDVPEVYSALLNGNRIYGAGRFQELYSHDISDPTRFVEAGHVDDIGGKGGYISFQDGFVHMGASTNYVKADVRDESNFEIVATASTDLPDSDEDFATVLGNLVILSDDHNNGSFIFPHQQEPDTTGPVVNMVVPADGAVHQRRTTRVGLTFTDLVDLRSVNQNTFSVRPVGGQVLTGTYSSQSGIVNFTPAAPLQPDTVYEISVPQGGIRDVSGNETEEAFTAYFSTGSLAVVPPTCAILPLTPAEVDEEITFVAQLLAGTGPVEFAWDFGDGAPATAFTTAAQASHTYAAPGHYTVRATVRNGEYSSQCVARQTVHRPLTAPQPTSSSTIILDQSGQRVWNVNPDNHTVSVVDVATLSKLREHPVGPHPSTLAQAPDGAIWVVNRDNATISVLDEATGAPAATILLPHASQPHGIVFSPDGSAAYVTLQATSQLLKLDPQTRTIVASLDVGPTPRGLAISGDGARIFVSRFLSPDDRGEIREVRSAPFAVADRIELPYDPGPDTESSGRGLPNALHAPVISPDGRWLWAPAKKDNTARGVLRDGQPLTFDSTMRTIVAQIDLHTNNEDLATRLDFEDRSMAVAVAFSPLGDYAFVALQGSNAIEIIDVYSGRPVSGLEDVGRAPAGLVLSADGAQLFVHSFLSRSVLVYDVYSMLNNDIQLPMLMTEIDVVEQEQLSPTVLTGKRIFYDASDPRMSRDGYISCAACHLDGADDGRTWDRTDAGEGFRNTISLLGRGGLEHGPLHWTANFDEVQDFEHDMRDFFGGTGFLAEELFDAGTLDHPLGDPKAGLNAELDALAAYVSSLRRVPASPYRPTEGGLTDAARAGKALFAQRNCAACHGGPHFTDSPRGLRHHVGTLDEASGQRLGEPLLGLDTPTLRGLWASAPYLHDGSAATLTELFTTADPAGLHTGANPLAAAEVQQLVAYLVQIDENEPDAPTYAPAIVLQSPPHDTVHPVGAPIAIEAETNASIGAATTVEFYVNGGSLGADDTAPFTWQWQPTAAGEYRITAVATHDNGIRTVAREHQVLIGGARPDRPTATPTPTPTAPGATPAVTPSPPPTEPGSTPTPGGAGDADSDGIVDPFEDVDGDGNPLNDDTDGDGLPNVQDGDDDGDGIATRDELSVDDQFASADDARDTDGDGLPDYLDADDDGDGWPTRLESAFDINDNGIPDHLDGAVQPTPLYLPLVHRP